MKTDLFIPSDLKKYNIAFVPKLKSEDFITLTKDSKHIENYCVGPESIPHITICQFYYNPDQIESLWDEICSEPLETTISLSFKEFSIISFDNNLYWISLLPYHVDKLTDIFNIISKKVECIRKDTYDPHLTLFNSHLENAHLYDTTKEIFIEDNFELVLGETDEIGQLKYIMSNANRNIFFFSING